MKRPKLLLLLMFPVIALFTGCYPDKIDYVDEYDVAATMYDEEADFTSYTTYTVVDTIMHLTDDGEDDPNFTRDFDDLILNLIRENMTMNGYMEVPDADSLNPADLTIFVEALSSDYYQYWGGYYDYWGWYGGWGWGWGGWYPGYPWYPSYPWYPGYVTSYSTGTLLVEMFDSESYDPEANTVDGIWLGLVDGMLYKDKAYTIQRLEKQINQLFEQSEYLQQ
ncbi:MAG: DUF4136 domain-containing protein [Bacteroidota bacterium]